MTRKRVAGAIGALVSKKGQQLTVCKSVTQNFADSDVIKSCYGIGGDREVYKLWAVQMHNLSVMIRVRRCNWRGIKKLIIEVVGTRKVNKVLNENSKRWHVLIKKILNTIVKRRSEGKLKCKKSR